MCEVGHNIMIRNSKLPRQKGEILFEQDSENENELDLLSILLGSVNNISTLGELSQDNVASLNELTQYLFKGLPKLRTHGGFGQEQ